jgi:glycine hydroxymethyltransferase
MRKRLKNIYDLHKSLRNESINLLPSENAISPMARMFLSGDMGQRYFFKTPYNSSNGISYSYCGTKYIEETVQIGEALAKELFHAKYTSLYSVSGHLSNIGMLFAYTKPGDSIIVSDPNYVGYPGLDKNMLPKYFNLNVYYLPHIDGSPELIDYEKTSELIRNVKPKIVVYSSAHTLFPIKIEEISNYCLEVDAKFIYDGSHPLGLIAGGEFQDPLNEGADILIGGTQKSFPGPQGGIIATNNCGEEIEKVNHFVIVDNPHFHRISALTVALAEMKDFGKDYANQVILNTKTLANELYKAGLPVRYANMGFTESHMFKLELFNEFQGLINQLEQSQIMLDSAGRIGTAEMTRYGMKEDEMKIIANLIIKVWKGTDAKNIKNTVIELRKSFKNVHFC